MNFFHTFVSLRLQTSCSLLVESVHAYSPYRWNSTPCGTTPWDPTPQHNQAPFGQISHIECKTKLVYISNSDQFIAKNLCPVELYTPNANNKMEEVEIVAHLLTFSVEIGRKVYIINQKLVVLINYWFYWLKWPIYMWDFVWLRIRLKIRIHDMINVFGCIMCLNMFHIFY